MTSSFVTDESVENFIRDGYVVIPDVFTLEEVDKFRDSLHNSFAENDVCHGKKLSFGPHTQMFYPSWKLAIQEDPRFFGIVSAFWERTFAKGIPGFETPFLGFDPYKGYSYIDRVGYRLPDRISNQGGIGLHVDCNPLDPYSDSRKWRPIQASVTLTNCLTPSSGGLCVVPGIHTSLDKYVNHPGSGIVKFSNFTRLDTCSELVGRAVPVVAPAGSIILWDSRLPHGTVPQHDGPDAREVLFMTFLPDIPRNRVYAAAQLASYFAQRLPPDFQGQGGLKSAEEPTHTFSELGKRLMSLEPWPEKEGDSSVDFGQSYWDVESK